MEKHSVGPETPQFIRLRIESGGNKESKVVLTLVGWADEKRRADQKRGADTKSVADKIRGRHKIRAGQTWRNLVLVSAPFTPQHFCGRSRLKETDLFEHHLFYS